MKDFPSTLMALMISIGFSNAAMAQPMSADGYQAAKEKIEVDYKSDKAGCDSLSGNAKDICVIAAKGKEKVARAELEANIKPTAKNRYQARVAKAQADYAVAKERCDDMAGNTKDVCLKEAKAAEIAAKADAKAQMKSINAQDTAREKSTSARSEANRKSSEARQDAATEKRDARYQVAKEKCDTYSGDAKENCLNQAKVQFEKP